MTVDAFAIGSYTPATGGRGAGLSLVARDPRSGRLGAVGVVADCPSPSFLAAGSSGPDGLVHAAHELDEGFVSTHRLTADGWELLGQVSSGGSFPCHLTVTGEFLVAANYGGGVGVVRLRDGVASELVQTVTAHGSGPELDRQEASHPHSSRVVGERVAVFDLGTDEIRRYTLTGEGLTLDETLVLPPGTGPRHAAVDGDHLFVAGELDVSVTSLRAGDVLGVNPAIVTPGERRVFPSEIARAPWGLVVANRRADVVTLHEIVDGVARPVRDVAIGAENPRHVTVVENHLYVAAQDSDRIVHLAIDDDLTVVDRSEVEIGSPACVLPL